MRHATIILIALVLAFASGCASEAIRQVASENVAIAAEVHHQAPDALKPPLEKLVKGTSAVSKYLGEPSDRITSEAEFDAAVATVEAEADSKKKYWGWLLPILLAIIGLWESEATKKTGPISWVVRIAKSVLTTEEKKASNG